MLIIEFLNVFNSEINSLRYRDINSNAWNYLYIDIKTLNLLILNYGIISTYEIVKNDIHYDKPSTNMIKIKYYNSDIYLCCKN